MFKGQRHRTPCGAHWSISPEVKGPRDPRGPTGRLPHLWNPEDFTLLFFFNPGEMVRDGCCHPGASAAEPVLLVLCPDPSPAPLLARPRSVWDARRGNAAAATGSHSLLALWWSSPVRSRLAARRPRPLRAGPANHRRFQTGPMKGRFSSSPPPTDILGDTVRKEKYFLKVTLWFWRDYLP